ncbi:MAG: hypothetical protein KatS3mg002_0855 [Candidatus Woesearchaeota archaeon]|nr:MAG: hypothetical protein KatS3mg002_0855 [Candidatus Woesearchaeota archaeon]
MDEFLPNPELEEKNKNSKIFICTQCGECCHIREKKDISEEEEKAYFSYMYNNFGIIYFAKLSDVTITIWPEEKEVLEKIAKEKGVNISFKSKRGYYDAEDKSLIIIDYYIDADICPFFNRKAKQCTIYENRPLICRSYPLLTTKTLGKCKYKKNDVNDYESEKIYAKKLDEKTYKIKKLLKEMISNKRILLDKKDLEDVRNIKELRI